MNNNIIKNKYGYYEVDPKPTQKELEEFYEKKYYQNDQGAYQKTYSTNEIEYFDNKNKQKHHELSKLLKVDLTYCLLDIGCGEGFTLKYFNNNGWNVKGLDYSNAGMLQHNPELINFMVTGDIYKNIETLTPESFDVIWLDNVLEHVISPQELLNKCHSLCKPNGIIVIEVPNDFSSLQLKAKELNFIETDFWVVLPDHLSYFNLNGLNLLAESCGWEYATAMSDFPIDFNLFNINSNYVRDKSTGKGSHEQRVMLDNLMSEISVEKANDFFKSLANLGLGRQIIGFYKKR